MILPVGEIIGNRYEIIEKIGSGGMAIVYRAKDRKLERFVTVKVLREEFIGDEEFKSRFKIEARSAASLSHPNIVNVYDVGEEGDIYYIVMEYVHGDTLKRAILENAPFENLTTLSVAIQIAAALSHAHKNHIIHRDIKPQNILVATDGTIKVTDFGIARAATTATVTTTANAIGSVYYFSPEQARGGYVDEKSDIYSLGISMFEMATGQLPYEGETSVAIALKHLNEELPDIYDLNPRVTDGLVGIIKKATRKKADERYANIDLMLADLKTALSEASTDYGREEPPASRQRARIIEDEDLDYVSSPRQRNFSEPEEDEIEDGIRVEISKPRTRKRVIDEPLPEIDMPPIAPPLKKTPSRAKVSAEDNYEDDYEDDYQPPSRPPKKSNYRDDYDNGFDEDKAQERKVIIAAIATALVIILIITIVGFKFFWGENDKNPKSPEGSGVASSQSQTESDASGVQQTAGTVIPNFVGMSFTQAQTKAKENNLTVETLSEEYSSKYEQGIVINQSQTAGTAIGTNKVVKLTVSKGLQSFEMPGVKNLEESQAVSAITKAAGEEMNVQIDYHYSDDIEAGLVISQSPLEGVKVTAQDAISLIVSRGKEQQTSIVPNLVNKTEADAKQEIESAGLKVGKVTNTESDTVAVGVVMAQTLEAGKEVASDSVVSLVVSSGAPAQSGTVDQPDPGAGQNTRTEGRKTYTITTPIGQGFGETVEVEIIKIDENGNNSTVLQETRKLSEFPFDVTVAGTGKNEVQLYLDGNYQWSEYPEFSEGGSQ